MPERPTSEQLRLEAEKLRDTAVKLVQHAATLISRAGELEKQIARLDPRPEKEKTLVTTYAERSRCSSLAMLWLDFFALVVGTGGIKSGR